MTRGSRSDFTGELYDGITCVYTCQVTDGTPVVVTEGATSSGIDFRLKTLGVLEGQVTDAKTGAPIDGASVRAFREFDFSFFRGTGTDATGAFRLSGLPPDTYFLSADANGYAVEAYAETPCAPSCVPTFATPVTVGLEGVVSGLDFTLERLGSISGTVTVAATGAPVASGELEIFDAQGEFVGYGFMNAAGFYRTSPLQPGTYFVRTAIGWRTDFLDELYDNLPCYKGCDAVTGAPVTVLPGAETSGIDFALEFGGSISGTVTDSLTGNPVASAHVELWILGGSALQSTPTAADGTYAFLGLAPQTYEASTDPTGYLGQRSAPVEVAVAGTVSGVDFALDPLGAITGTVLDAATGAPPFNANIHAYNAQGQGVGPTGFPDPSGAYRLPDLLPGTYFVVASAGSHLDEVYDDILCQGCSPTKGTPVTVISGVDTSGIDFLLEPLQAGLTGTVLDVATNRPVGGVGVQIWDSGGNPVAKVFTRDAGVWLADLPAGTYFVSTDAQGAYFDQVYPGIACAGSCNPLAGAPITVPSSFTVVREVDFFLERVPGIFTDGFESGDVAAWGRAVP